jgi:hypothetical protein
MIRILSLGAGVQSSTLALMMKHGEIEIDKAIRVVPKMNNKQYMHRSCKPIDQVEFTNKAQVDMFGNECEGLCGV